MGSGVTEKFFAIMNASQVSAGTIEQRQGGSIKRRFLVSTGGLLLTEEFLNFIKEVLTDGNIRMKTAEENCRPEIIRAHLGPKIAGVSVEDHLLDGGNSLHVCLSGVCFGEIESHRVQ